MTILHLYGANFAKNRLDIVLLDVCIIARLIKCTEIDTLAGAVGMKELLSHDLLTALAHHLTKNPSGAKYQSLSVLHASTNR